MESGYNYSNSKTKENLELLKYWRPISLLCTDYKILTKILANRLKQVLPDIISQEQNCSIPDRTIFKACVRYFLSNFYFFTKRYPFKNCEKCFLFHLKSSFRSRDIQFFVNFSLPFHTFQIEKGK